MPPKDYSYIYWIHILFVGPLFLYIGFNKEKTPDIVFNSMIGLGFIVLIYHSYLLLKYYKFIN